MTITELINRLENIRRKEGPGLDVATGGISITTVHLICESGDWWVDIE